MTGQVPVKGHYKYLLQDPKAILATLRSEYKLPGSVRNEGKIIVPSNIGIRPDQAVISVYNKEKNMEVPYVGEVGLLRNPAVVYGEGAFVEAVYDEAYAKNFN
ncbi:hypothetical protein [Heyndrickxia camelliae]|uniref:Uncharacterized protein n=1 Tax=Heyndrickxia camelliae TaxID=1707093 RepID=A0A2N3LD45_9BACI|nr:hypothetical protein [Heyndrickxia camelliae]PKR82467.1 hypothetical protein CWO92_24320 [Heyndrickxia camelliae]